MWHCCNRFSSLDSLYDLPSHAPAFMRAVQQRWVDEVVSYEIISRDSSLHFDLQQQIELITTAAAVDDNTDQVESFRFYLSMQLLQLDHWMWFQATHLLVLAGLFLWPLELENNLAQLKLAVVLPSKAETLMLLVVLHFFDLEKVEKIQTYFFLFREWILNFFTFEFSIQSDSRPGLTCNTVNPI